MLVKKNIIFYCIKEFLKKLHTTIFILKIKRFYQQLKNAINISLDKGCYWFINYQFETHQLLMPHTWLLEAYEKLKQVNVE